MESDQFTVTLLVSSPDAPKLDEPAEKALQDEHMAFLADLHQAGPLLAAGLLSGAADRPFCGLSILDVEPSPPSSPGSHQRSRL